MNAPLYKEVLLPAEGEPQGELRLETEGVLRYKWCSRWGDMLIEVQDGVARVNGELVRPAHSSDGER